jgi:hypothetical protein
LLFAGLIAAIGSILVFPVHYRCCLQFRGPYRPHFHWVSVLSDLETPCVPVRPRAVGALLASGSLYVLLRAAGERQSLDVSASSPCWCSSTAFRSSMGWGGRELAMAHPRRFQRFDAE